MSNTMLKLPPNFFRKTESDSINWELIFLKDCSNSSIGGKTKCWWMSYIYLFPRIIFSMYPVYAPLPGLHRLDNYSFYEKKKNRKDFFHKLYWVKTVKIVWPVFQTYDQIYLCEANSQTVSVIPNRRVEGRSNLLDKVAN